MAGHLCPSAVRTLPLLSPILSPSRFPYSGRYKRGMASELRALQQPGLEFRESRIYCCAQTYVRINLDYPSSGLWMSLSLKGGDYWWG
eukprot:scaffold944_cov139-Isochrysis_galbana.AAC.1